MTVVVSIDCGDGTLRRYETGGVKRRPTHEALPDGPTTVSDYSPALIAGFRAQPDPAFAVAQPRPIPSDQPRKA